MRMPPIETTRLLIRPFTPDDLATIHHILDVELADAEVGTAGTQSRDARERWLRWTILGYEQYAALYQPPYGERAIVLKDTGQVIGSCGYVPCLDQFGRLPSLRATDDGDSAGFSTTEFGLYWAVSPTQQRLGYATEAATALIDDAFTRLGLRRIVATTTHDNMASIRVMEKVGMRIDTNPSGEPPWLQVVGVVYHPKHEKVTETKSVSTNPPCSKGIVSKPTGAQSVVPWASGGRAHRHRAVPGVWRLRAGECGTSGDRWWPQDRVFFGNNGPRGQPEGKVEGPWVCGHALREPDRERHPV